MGATEVVAVYVAEGLDSGLLKIGSTGCVPERMKALANAVEPVALLASMAAPLAMEAELHERFSALRDPSRRREWFRDDGSILAFVATLPAHQRGRVEFQPRAPRGGRRSSEKYPRESALLWPLQGVATPRSAFAARLRSLRLAASLSPAELSLRAGFKSPSYVTKLEDDGLRGRRVSARTLLALSDALGCSYVALTSEAA